jgi:hypothetical protein
MITFSIEQGGIRVRKGMGVLFGNIFLKRGMRYAENGAIQSICLGFASVAMHDETGLFAIIRAFRSKTPDS